MLSRDDRLRALLDEYGHVLRRAIRRAAPRELEAELDDIEQEARLRVWGAIQKETVLERPASYLYRLAVNATLKAVEKRRSRREQALPEEGGSGGAPPLDEASVPSASPEARAARRQEMEEVRRALARVAENRRRAVGLHLQGFTTREIGELCGWTEAKARNLAYRGLDDLRRQLQDLRRES